MSINEAKLEASPDLNRFMHELILKRLNLDSIPLFIEFEFYRDAPDSEGVMLKFNIKDDKNSISAYTFGPILVPYMGLSSTCFTLPCKVPLSAFIECNSEFTK